MMDSDFHKKGWQLFDYDAGLMDWIKQILPHARNAIADPDNQRWLRCGGTWFAGVNVLPNAVDGSINGGTCPRGPAIKFIHHQLGIDPVCWDRAQLSVCYPGYPRPMASESAAAFNYRQRFDAAHVDGLLPEGNNRRRHLREAHSFILGIPMVEFNPGAAPFVVWQGSHEIVRETFEQRLVGLDPSSWGDEDVTDIYQAMRRDIFQRCARFEIHARPGQAFIVHRLCLHGIAPWPSGVQSNADGRMICYFRPLADDPSAWLRDP